MSLWDTAKDIGEYGTPIGWLYQGVGDRQIPRRIGEDRGGVIGPVHHSPVKIWAGGFGAA